jgi:hypothetical protein
LLALVAGSEDHQSLAEVKKQFQDLHDTTNDTWKKVENSRKIAEIAGKLMGAEVRLSQDSLVIGLMFMLESWLAKAWSCLS